MKTVNVEELAESVFFAVDQQNVCITIRDFNGPA